MSMSTLDLFSIIIFLLLLGMIFEMESGSKWLDVNGSGNNLHSGHHHHPSYLHICSTILSTDVSRQLHHNEMILGALSIVSSSLSILGSGSIVIYSVWRGIHKSLEVEPLLHLSIADFLLSLMWISSAISFFVLYDASRPDITATTCFVWQFMAELIHIVTFLLTINYAVNVYLRMCNRAERMVQLLDPGQLHIPQYIDHKWIQPLLYVISWLLPILLMFPVLEKASKKHISSCQKCLILIDVPRLEGVGDMWQKYGYVLLVTMLCLAIISIVVIYMLTMKTYWQAVPTFHTDRQRRILGNMQTRVTLYILAFLTCWGPALTISAYKLSLDGSELDSAGATDPVHYYGLYIAQAVFAPMQGFLNSLVYGWTRKSFRQAIPPEQTRLLVDPVSACPITNSYLASSSDTIGRFE